VESLTQPTSPRQEARNQPAEAAGWRKHADALADWALRRLVIRRDAYGVYSPVELRGKLGTQGKPVPKLYTRKQPLTRGVLVRHFRGRLHHHVIGAHSTGPDNVCLWGAFDVDCHGEATDPAVTHDLASGLYLTCREIGLHPVLTDSDGNGGYHVWQIFSGPVPSRDLYELLRSVAVSNAYRGDVFPKQRAIKPNGYGNWLRLPGYHHTRDHWSRIYDGQHWLSGADAAEFLLTVEGDDPVLVPPAPPLPEPPPATARFPWQGGAHKGDCDLKSRIAAYVARCPNKSEGEGRDDVAFHLASFLVRDLAQPDDEALVWLSVWDEGNSPPKGDDRLREVIANAHAYGKNVYGSGLKGGER
jgi:hypothetical protein